jgi:pyruvate,water dikinase
MSPELLALMPRLALFAVDKAFFGRRIVRKVAELTAAYDEFFKNDLARMNEKELIDSYEELRQLNSDAAYYNIVTPLLLHFYNWMLKSSASKHALDLEAFDIVADIDELSEYDPSDSLRTLGDKFASLGPEAREAISDHKASKHSSEDVESLRKDISNFLRKFGHLSDSGNDFSAPPWRENPALVIAMLPSFATESKVLRRPPPFEALRAARRSAAFNFAYKMSRIYRVRKEQVGSLYTYGYGLFRQVFIELGKRFVAREILKSPEDIFYLSLDEVRECIDGRDDPHKYGSIVDRTKNEMEASKDAAMPTIIFGNQAPPLQMKLGHELRGVPSSRGYYSGPAKIVRSIQEFAKLEKGDVLIIPYSDVGMTPLFSKAGAVVSESGGILSHSSIIAREYGIPAVVSVNGACSIPDNTWVSVDGFEGRVMSTTSKDSDES